MSPIKTTCSECSKFTCATTTIRGSVYRILCPGPYSIKTAEYHADALKERLTTLFDEEWLIYLPVPTSFQVGSVDLKSCTYIPVEKGGIPQRCHLGEDKS